MQNVAKLIGELADQMRASEELSRTTQTVRSLEKHLHELEAEVASARSTAESLQAQLHDSRAALTAAGVKQRALEEDALVQAADVERRLGAVREQLELEHAHAIGKLNDRIETLTQSAAAEHDGVRERCEQLALENGALRAAVDNATQEQEARTEQLVKELETHYADKETQWQKEIDDAYG
jgi:chromosome segregation ATPase